MKKTLSEIAQLIDGSVIGDGSIEINGVCGIKEAKKGEITFVANPKYIALMEQTDASAIITTPDVKEASKPLIITENPSLAFAKLLSLVAPNETNIYKGIHPTAVVGKDVKIGKDVAIHPFAVIEDFAEIGDNTVLAAGVFVGFRTRIGKDTVVYPHVSIRERVDIGDRVIIHSGTVIGSDGFGFATVKGLHQKIPQIGTVVIEDDVEIGANVTIDRARFDKTHIKHGTKIDNLVQIAHNVVIGENSIIVAQAGISGSTMLGKNVTLAGQAGVIGHISIGDNAVVAAQAGVTKSVSDNTCVSGYPAKPHKRAKRINACVQKLPDLYKMVNKLENKIAALEQALEEKKMDLQKTISNSVEISGVGLHTGQKVKVRFAPAPENNGVEFIRVDQPDKPRVKAHMSNLIARPRRTSIGVRNIEIHTIEHVMAALVGLGIDNIIIELDAEELPGLDGSSLPFFEILKKAGVVEQKAQRVYFQPKEPLFIEDGDSSVMILPANKFRVSYTMSYPHPMLKSQYASFDFDEKVFEKELAPSRTFCLQQEAEELTRQGLGKGANYDNTVVVGDNEIVNNELRFDDEFVRHKMCDLIGDLYLLGHPVIGHVIGIKSGHPLNIKLLQKMKNLHDRQTQASIGAISADFNSTPPLNINDIQQILPHRYPFLLVDKIIEIKEDKSAVGIKNVTINELFFQGHFPGRPVMPGVLIIESMAQVVGVLLLSKSGNHGKRAYFMSIDKVKFRRMVLPGDQLRLEVEVLKLKSKVGQAYGKALVDNKVVAEAVLMFTLGE